MPSTGVVTAAEAELEAMLERVDEAVYERRGGGSVQMRPICIIASAATKVILDNFRTNSATLTPEQRCLISAIAQNIIDSFGTSKQVKRVRIVGHTDSRGSDAFNRNLGLKRAKEVKKLLANLLSVGAIGKPGFTPPPIDVVTQGKTSPRASNSTAAGMAQNRRAEVFLAR